MSAALGLDPQGFSTFYKDFFHGASSDDLDAFSADSLKAIASIFWKAAAVRKRGASFLRVFSPTAERDGFSAPFSLLITINDDKPFLVDSILSELGERGLKIKAVFHPIFKVARDRDGAFNGFAGASHDGHRESMICVAFSRVGHGDQLVAVEDGIARVLRDVEIVVSDWKTMIAKLDESIAELWQNQPRASKEEIDECLAFLQWLKQNHFTFLGCRDYTFDTKNDGRLTPIAQSGLGILRNPERRVLRRGTDRSIMTPEVRAFMEDPSPLIITKSLERSPVHRRVQEDYIGIKRFGTDGELIGERRFIGLFTSAAYHDSPREIPFLRRKVANVMARAGFAKGSHNAKALAVVLETLPRDELFQVSEADLLRMGPALAYLGDRPETDVFIRFDQFERFASVHVYFPSDKFRGGLIRSLGSILTTELGGQIASAYPHTEEGHMARIHFNVVFPEGRRGQHDHAKLKARLIHAVKLWSDHFLEALNKAMAPEHVETVYARYATAFNEAYRESYGAAEAILDIEKLEHVAQAGPGSLALRSSSGTTKSDGIVHFKLYHAGGVIELSDLVPVLEAFGLRIVEEVNYAVTRDGQELTIHVLKLRGNVNLERDEAMKLFEDAFMHVWRGLAESDGFNRLVLLAELHWRDVALLRAVAKYLRQAAFGASQVLMEEALSRHPRIAAALTRLFQARFALHNNNPTGLQKTVDAEIDEALAKVPSLDDDRIIRRMRNVIQSMLRTNFFQTGKPSISFKIDSSKIEDLPLPRPMFEIFVYAPEVEGVHMRFGKVARGGLRWSDRREDFRTEILGLVKAQQVKNAVIVPVGSKGGFYPKRLPPSSQREAWLNAGIAAYKLFVSSLLDITDNIDEAGKIVPPANVVRHDADDPYLVVAADKGTATFSDIANGISREYGFWLADAFASGGSAGYDHKKMGITAKGAWETVKRHFREIGTDIQTKPFTVVGVGDMSGDVFGNGMLLSHATKLVAAFDHRDIFLDPDPDSAVSFAERQRIFNLPRSSWADYDQSKISKGGGVYSRSMKRIPLSPEVRALSGLTSETAEPAELMKALLKAPVDLLWFGGIGTFVKSNRESNSEAGDKANDAVRIDGRDVRAKVIGEGANLGCTQAGRIEYAMNGGRLNTDAIDNSAGVDTSDHEVNLKILLNASISAHELKSTDRDSLLAGMTDEVADLVLADNYNQSLALSVAQSGGAWESDAYGRFMRALERDGRLNRAVEGLPSDENLRERANRNEGLTRPELAVLLAYAKLQLFDEINGSSLPDDPYLAGTLKAYFPSDVREKFPVGMGRHRLKREIIATMLSNDIINRGGPVFMHRLKEASASEAPGLARAYTIALNAFSVPSLARQINALDNKVPATVQVKMHARLALHLQRQTLWFFRNDSAREPIAEVISPFANGVAKLRGTFSTLVSDAERRSILDIIAEMRAAGVPDELADDIGALPAIGATPDITQLTFESKKPLDMVAGAFFSAAQTIGVDRLRLAAERMNLPEHWDRLAVRRLIDDLGRHQRELASRALQLDVKGDSRSAGSKAIALWAQSHQEQVQRVNHLITDLERSGTFTVARLTLAAGQIRDLLG